MEEETGAYWVVREDFRRPRTPQTDFFSSLLDNLLLSRNHVETTVGQQDRPQAE